MVHPIEIKTGIVTEWEEYYIPYHKFLRELRLFRQQNLQPTKEQKNEYAERFARKLNFQIERVNYFSNIQSGSISGLLNGHLASIKVKVSRLSDTSLKNLFRERQREANLKMIRDFHREFVIVAKDVKKFMIYLEWNVRSIQKLRKSVGKYVGKDIPEFQRLDEVDLLSELYSRNSKWDTTIILRAFNKTFNYFEYDTTERMLDAKIESSNEIAWSSQLVHLRSMEESEHVKTILGFINTLARVFDRLSVAEEGLLLRISEDNQTPRMPGLLKRRGDIHVREMILYKNYLIRRAVTFKKLIQGEFGAFMDSSYDNSVEEIERRNQLPAINIWLNLLNTLLYIISMYAPLSTAGHYAKSLGSTEALFGIIIGGTPLAGFFFAILWAKLSNHGFKIPFLLSSIACLLGNVVYASASTWNSITIAIIGRFLVGVGGARAVNRRYIADNVPEGEQTMQSFRFVVASALGMPLGPFFSLLCNLPPEFSFMGLNFTDNTNAAWGMAIVWIIYIIVILKYFEEPGEKNTSSSLQHSNSFYDLTTDDERQPLIPEDDGMPTISEQVDALRRNPPIQFLLLLYVIIKLANEVALTGAAFYLPHIFKWSSISTAIYLAILGLSIILVGPILKLVIRGGEEGDRSVLLPSMTVGVVMCLFSLPVFEEAQTSIKLLVLVTGTTFIFIFMNAAESCCMSIISKVRPSALKYGTFNTALLQTQAGLVGRALAGYMIFLAAPKDTREMFTWSESRSFFWKMFLPTFALCAIGVAGIYHFYDRLAAEEEDNEADDADIDGDAYDESDQETEPLPMFSNYALPIPSAQV